MNDVLRRVIGAVFCRRDGRKLADYFQPWEKYGVAVSDGVEIKALTATRSFKEGCTILSYDGAVQHCYRRNVPISRKERDTQR